MTLAKDFEEIKLLDFWCEKLEIANEKKLTRFYFVYKGKSYYSEWLNQKWTEPIEITRL